MFYTKLKTLVLSSTFLLVGALSAQLTIISPTDTIFASLDTLNELNSGEISLHWDVVNESNSEMTLMCTRTFVDTVSPFNYPYVQSLPEAPVEGAYEKFCWGPLCYNYGTDASSQNPSLLVTLPSGATESTFIAYYYPYDVLGTTTIEYCFHPVDDVAAGSCHQITYVIDASASTENNLNRPGESTLSMVYPNPLEGMGWLKYDIRVGQVADVVFRDLAGKEIMRESGLVLSGKIAIHSDKLTQGLCFCTLEIDGFAVKTERFVVIR
ncbi:MAG: hypothetical protein CL831_05255 [Crocinitomicaceae bacterium]|nr:hypothetical protein [Crocinitomicaceae bacterium]